MFDQDGVAWIAECRANTGTWLIREDESVTIADDLDRECKPQGIRGAMFPFVQEAGLLLMMTPEQRKDLGLSDATYHEINVELSLAYKRYNSSQ